MGILSESNESRYKQSEAENKAMSNVYYSLNSFAADTCAPYGTEMKIENEKRIRDEKQFEELIGFKNDELKLLFKENTREANDTGESLKRNF